MKRLIFLIVIFIVTTTLQAAPKQHDKPVYLHFIVTGLQYRVRHITTKMNSMKECLIVLEKSKLKITEVTDDELPIAATMWCGGKINYKAFIIDF